MGVQREVELKIDLDPSSLKALRDGSLASVGPEDVVREMLTSVYFDTKKLSLQRKGLSLRIRREAGRRIQTLKGGKEGGGGLFDRLEWNTEVAGDSPDLDAVGKSPFGPVLDPRRLHRRLRPVFSAEVDRTVWRVRSAGAEVEVALDEGVVTAGEKSSRFAELELELKGGPPSELFNVARSLLPGGRLKPGVLAKSERGYSLLASEPPASFKAEPLLLKANVSTEEAFKAIVRACIRHFRLNEALLLDTRGPEPLHQCRVALRRLRTAFSLFKEVIADAEVEALKDRMRSLTRKLGAARDLDVYLGKLNDPPESGSSFVAHTEDVVERVRRDREKAYERVIAALRGKHSHGLMFDILAWSEAGPWLGSVDEERQTRRGEPIERFAADVLEHRSRKIRRRGRHLEDLDPPARHSVRIEAKKLRYATEFFSSLAATKKGRRRHEVLSTALAALQEHLGELNDLATGENLARESADRVGAGPAVGASLGQEKAAKTSLKAATSSYREIAKAKPFWR